MTNFKVIRNLVSESLYEEISFYCHVHFEFPAGARPEIQDIKFYWVRKPYFNFYHMSCMHTASEPATESYGALPTFGLIWIAWRSRSYLYSSSCSTNKYKYSSTCTYSCTFTPFSILLIFTVLNLVGTRAAVPR